MSDPHKAHEEIAIRLDRDELTLAGTVHCLNPEGQGRLGIFFHAGANPARQGQPRNAEPHKCAQLGWFRIDRLPDNTVPYITAGVDLYRHGQPFAAPGWDAPPGGGSSPAHRTAWARPVRRRSLRSPQMGAGSTTRWRSWATVGRVYQEVTDERSQVAHGDPPRSWCVPLLRVYVGSDP
jgi:hypothetical protein